MTTPENTVVTDEMRAMIGAKSAPVTYDIEKGAVDRFARAISYPESGTLGERAERSSPDGSLIAPPTFLRSLIPGRYATPFPEPFSFVLDAGSDYRFFEPVRVGDRITVTRKIVDLFEKRGKLGSMLFKVHEISYENHLGRLAATQRTTTISYGTGPRDPAIDEL